MVGSFRYILPALCALAFVNSPVYAFWGRTNCTTSSTLAPVWHSSPAQCWGTPVAPPYSPAPKPKSLTAPLQAPTPTTKEPPLRAPSITESRSPGGVMPTQAADVAPGRCKVGFWNITGEDVSLTIDGQERKLPKNRAVTLELGRTFVWQRSGRGPQTERVPEGENVFEVILRP